MKQKFRSDCIRSVNGHLLAVNDKNMKNKTILGVGALALVLGLGVAGSTLAYQGDPNVKGPNYSPARHEAMIKAFETNDYVAWKNIMQNRGRVTQVINQSNFAKFAEAHKLALEGKTAEAQKIRQELGLGLKNGAGNKMFGSGMK